MLGFVRFSFLCLRRGVSQYTGKNEDFAAFSLPTQRCFYGKTQKEIAAALFSAYAEVFLPADHPCGNPCRFSLPTQRCFQMITTTTLKGVLFSAYAEVFLKKKPDYMAIATFLCLRRGVSNVLASK